MLDYFALGLLFFVGLVLFYGIIVMHDIPYEIAVHRNHPHQDAIHATGWVSLFTLHVLWPFLWIWAMLYREDRGWGFSDGQSPQVHVAHLEQQVGELQQRVAQLEAAAAPEPVAVPAPTPAAAEQPPSEGV
ncbi:MAG: DUF3302 domain-containing protein [Pseudomonas sp.]